jgi:dihydrofolate reductase
MGKVTFDMSLSVDGFIAGPNMNPEQGLGEGGDRVHEWFFDTRLWREMHGEPGGTDSVDGKIIGEALSSPAVFVMGRNMFGGAGDWDNPEWGDERWEGWWGDEPPYHRPVFVVTHHAREPLVKSDTTFTFVTEGVESAVEQAQAVVGGGEVSVAGGASVIQQALAAGLVDEFQLHVAPVLLGAGVRLFANGGTQGPDLEITRTVEGEAVTHVRYRVVK